MAASPSHTSIIKRYAQIENRISMASSERDSPNRPITPEPAPIPLTAELSDIPSDRPLATEGFPRGPRGPRYDTDLFCTTRMQTTNPTYRHVDAGIIEIRLSVRNNWNKQGY